MLWNVHVQKGPSSIYLGQVYEKNEELARCAALSRFGIAEDEPEAKGLSAARIKPDDEFSVTRALG